MLRQSQKHFTGGSDRSDRHTIIYTSPVSASPRMIDKEPCDGGGPLAMIRTPDPFDQRNRTDDARSSPPLLSKSHLGHRDVRATRA
jgi:hypothetical protein